MKKLLLLFITTSFVLSQHLIWSVDEKYENGNIKVISYHQKIWRKIELVKKELYNENGQLIEEGNYKDGKEDGKWTEYYENGQIKEEGNYKNGKLKGRWRRFDEKGRIKEEKNFKYGKPVGKLPDYNEDGDINKTEKLKILEPPARPSVPVASEDKFFDEDITIEDTDFDDFEDWDAPPPPPSEGPNVKFIPYDKAPKPKIPIRPVYPEIAQEAGIEGTVYIQFFIDTKGNVTEAWVQKGIPNTGLNEAALSAVKKSKWKPAQRRDKKVGVWQTVPVKFELTSH